MESFQHQNIEPKKEGSFGYLKNKLTTALKIGAASVLLNGSPSSGPKDYSFEKDFGHAFSHARTVGEKEFKYKGEIYTTLTENLPGIPIKQRDDFSGNAMSKAGLTYAEFEADGAGVYENFYSTEHPYGKLFDLYRYYFGQPLENDVLSISKNSPENSKDKNARYISINDEAFIRDVIKEYNLLKNPLGVGESAHVSGYVNSEKFIDNAKEKLAKNNTTSSIGNFKIGRGFDKNGEYISYYDVFDYRSGQVDKMIGAKSFEIYDRIYVTDIGNGKVEIKKPLD